MAGQRNQQQRRDERKPTSMPPRRAWLTFALILLANFLLVRYLLPRPG